PRAMFGCESITPIFRWKHFGVVKSHPQGGRMGLDENVGNDDLSPQIATLSNMSRIFIVTDEKPRPSVERTFAHPGYVVRHQVVSQTIALRGRTIQIPGRRMNCETHAVADARG